ncbi:hypothetical protein [uncultured Caulobacter sp.]|uniref:hypothetical protein n=1 Tax=uncultured Caulobacter sp. TaxID=158749 RepID=UPI002609D6C9|nr:hypothetical protein [uncultured Caulobacter sp.]
MRVLVLSVVLVASPALAQQAPTPPAPAVPSPSPYVPTFGTQVAAPPPAASPSAEAPVQTQPATPPAAPAVPDSAQVPQAIDPLGDLISQSGQMVDEEEAETAGKPAPKHRGTILPIPPPESLVGPDGAPTKALVYELRVKGSIAAAQTLQGPLDGGWRVAAVDGAQIYALQIVDKAGGYTPLEGAWRDVRRPGTVGSTGLIDDLRRDGGDLIARFSPKGGESAVLTLRPAGAERWAGELVENGRTQPVVAEHLVPEAPPGYEGQGRGPYVWPPRVVASRSDAAPACSTKGKKGKALKAAKAKCAAAKRGKASALKKRKGGKAKAVSGHRGKAAIKGSSRKKRR